MERGGEGTFMGLEKASCLVAPRGGKRSTSSMLMMMMEEEDDYSAVPDAMDLIHLDSNPSLVHHHQQQLSVHQPQAPTAATSTAAAAAAPFHYQPFSNATSTTGQSTVQDRVVFLEKRGVEKQRPLQNACDYYHRLQREHAQTAPAPVCLPPTALDLGAVVESTLAETRQPTPSSFTPVQEEKSILAPISKMFTQHWIDIGADLNVLLLDFDAAFTLLIPNVEKGKPFKTNMTTVEVQTRLTSKGQKLTFMKFHFANPESKIVAPVLDDKALGYKLLKKRSACVFLGRTLDDIKSAPPRRTDPSEQVAAIPALAPRPQPVVLPCPTQSLSPSIGVPEQPIPKIDSSLMPPSHPPSWPMTEPPKPASSVTKSKDKAVTQVQNNPVPPSERVYPKNLISIYPALKEKELDKIVQCRYCNKRFSFLSEHLIHLKSHTHDVDKVVEMSIQVWVSDRKLKCDKCKKKKKYTLDYAKHKDSHEIYGLSCHLCEASVPIPANFGPHMEEFHPNELLQAQGGEKMSPRSEMIPLVPNLSSVSSTQRENNSNKDSLKVSFVPVAVKSSASSVPQEFVAKKSTPQSFMSVNKKHTFPLSNTVSVGSIKSHNIPFNSAPVTTSLQNLMNTSSSAVTSNIPLLQENRSPFDNSNHLSTPPEPSPKRMLQLSSPATSSPMLHTSTGSIGSGNSTVTALKSPPGFSSTSENLGIINSVFSPDKDSNICLQSPSTPVSSSESIHENLGSVSSAQNTSLMANAMPESQNSRKLNNPSDVLETQQWRSEDSRVIQSLFDDTESLSKNNESDKVGLSLSSVDSGVSDVNSASPSIPNFDRNVPLLSENKSIRDSLDSKPDEEFLSALDMYGLESQTRKMPSPMSMSNPGPDLVNRHNILTDEPMLEELPSKVMQLEELCNTIDVSMEDVPSVDREPWREDPNNGFNEKARDQAFDNFVSHSKLFDSGFGDNIESTNKCDFEHPDKKSEECNLAQNETDDLDCGDKFIEKVPLLLDKNEAKALPLQEGDDITQLGVLDQGFGGEVPPDLDLDCEINSCRGEKNSLSSDPPKTLNENTAVHSSPKSSEESDDDLGSESSPSAIYKCEKCGDEFMTSNSLNIHKISCISENNKCSLCGNRFMSLKSLKMHVSMCKKKSEAAKPENKKDLQKGVRASQNRTYNYSNESKNKKYNDENKNIIKIKPIAKTDENPPEIKTSIRRPRGRPKSRPIEHPVAQPQDVLQNTPFDDPQHPFMDSKDEIKEPTQRTANPIPTPKLTENKPSLKINVGQILRQKELQNRLKEKSLSKRNKHRDKLSSTSVLIDVNPSVEVSQLKEKSSLEVETGRDFHRGAMPVKMKSPKRPSLKMKFGLSNINRKLPERIEISTNKRALQEESNVKDCSEVKKIKKTDSDAMQDKHFGSSVRTDSDGHIKLRLTLSSKAKENCNRPLKMDNKSEIEPEVKKVEPLKLKLNKKPAVREHSPVHPLKIKLPLRKKDTKQNKQKPNHITSLKIPKLVIKKDLIKGPDPREKVFIKKPKLLTDWSRRKPVRNSLFQSLECLSCFVRLENIVAYHYDEKICKSTDGYIVKLCEKDCSSLSLKNIVDDSPPLLVPPLRLKLNKKSTSVNNIDKKPENGKCLSDVLSKLTGSTPSIQNRSCLVKKSKSFTSLERNQSNSDSKVNQCLSSTLEILLSQRSKNKIVSEVSSVKDKPPKSIVESPKVSRNKSAGTVSKKSSSHLGLTGADYRSRKRKRKKKVSVLKEDKIESAKAPQEVLCKKVPLLKISKKFLTRQDVSNLVTPPIKDKTNVFFAKKSQPKPTHEEVPSMNFYSYEEKQPTKLVDFDTNTKNSSTQCETENKKINHSQGPLNVINEENSENMIVQDDKSTDSSGHYKMLFADECFPLPKTSFTKNSIEFEISQEQFSEKEHASLLEESEDQLESSFEVEETKRSSASENNSVTSGKKSLSNDEKNVESTSFKHLDGVVQDEFLLKLNLWKSDNSKFIASSFFMIEPEEVQLSPFSSECIRPHSVEPTGYDSNEPPELSDGLNVVKGVIDEIVNMSFLSLEMKRILSREKKVTYKKLFTKPHIIKELKNAEGKLVPFKARSTNMCQKPPATSGPRHNASNPNNQNIYFKRSTVLKAMRRSMAAKVLQGKLKRFDSSVIEMKKEIPQPISNCRTQKGTYSKFDLKRKKRKIILGSSVAQRLDDYYSTNCKKARILPSIKRKGSPIDIASKPKKMCILKSQIGSYRNAVVPKIGEMKNLGQCPKISCDRHYFLNEQPSERNLHFNMRLHQNASNPIKIRLFENDFSQSTIIQISIDPYVKMKKWMLGDRKMRSNSWEDFTFDFSHCDNTAFDSGTHLVKTLSINSFIQYIVNFIYKEYKLIATKLRKVLSDLMMKKPLALTCELDYLDNISCIIPHYKMMSNSGGILKRRASFEQRYYNHIVKKAKFNHFPRAILNLSDQVEPRIIVEPLVQNLLSDVMFTSDTSRKFYSESTEVVRSIISELCNNVTNPIMPEIISLLENFDDCIPLLSIRVPHKIETDKEMGLESNESSFELIQPLVVSICDDIVRTVESSRDSMCTTDLIEEESSLESGQSVVEPIIQDLLDSL